MRQTKLHTPHKATGYKYSPVCIKQLNSDVLALDRRLLNILQDLFNTVHYSTVLDITQFKDGFQNCIDYIEK